MDYAKIKVKFTVDPTRKDTWASEIGYVQKEHGKWWAYPIWRDKVDYGFGKRESAEHWICIAYGVETQYREEKK
jgi:hypothetical protein